MKNVLVLCHGNINRSPACAAVLRLNFPDLYVKSAGFRDDHERASAKMRNAMLARGYPGLTLHWSRVVTKELVEGANTIVVMSPHHRDRLCLCYPDLAPLPIVLLGDYADPPVKIIPDPGFMRRDSPEFSNVVDLIISASLRLGRSLCDS